MQISIPEVKPTLTNLMEVNSTFDGKSQPISHWLTEHRNAIKKNRKLLANKCGTNDITILNLFLRALLVRAIKGEMGERVYEELKRIIKNKDDLIEKNYRIVLEKANYRWGVNEGSKVISDVVRCLNAELNWEWRAYIDKAEKEKENNYQDDPILPIKNINFKLRDLGLSDFSPHYAAFDLHVTRVLTRIGWLNYGFSLVSDSHIEMGNNPGNDKNYLFLHRLFVLLSDMTGGEFTPVDLDRIFWHLGKSKCGAETKCFECPINKECLTGKYRVQNVKSRNLTYTF